VKEIGLPNQKQSKHNTKEIWKMSVNNPAHLGVGTKSQLDRTAPSPQKITTFLWFNDNAEEAANFYVSLFKNSRIINAVPHVEGVPGPKASVLTIDFELDGQRFTGLNGGPQFKFTEAVSLVVHCKTQEEVDYFWEKLSEGGQKVECGWLKDKFGLFWQIVPDVVLEVFQSGDKEKTQRMMQAVMKMKKLDIAELKKAAEGK
jgi:predicted 3-demethylubiquinone-9 3-methyltransferase (glyoxalase superfamily)